MPPLLLRAGLAAALTLPVALAATSPWLAFRDPLYIAAGFAGIAAMALMPLQPLLAAGWLPGLPPARARRLHRLTGAAIFLAVALHVGGLWLTSPPDVIDALLLASPTPFSPWGVAAMWALLATALLAAFRRRLRWRTWRRAHTALALVIVPATAAHALLVEGAMEPASKAALAALLLLATFAALAWPRPAPR